MDAPVVAAMITGGVTVTGFIVQGVLTNRWIDKKRTADTANLENIKGAIALENSKQIEQLKTDLAITAQHRLKEIEAQVATRQKRRETRRESLELLFNATSIANTAARELLNDSVAQDSKVRIRKTADSLQKMSQFFEKVSEAEHNIHLTNEDVATVGAVQSELVRMFLLLDLDSDGNRERLEEAYKEFEVQFERFKCYVRSATADS